MILEAMSTNRDLLINLLDTLNRDILQFKYLE